ncbi:uncharacterized protein EV154DRAFT_526201 [Mucor mucedo]|uniref:uncharacterized protein n=1 Tax=Mucor mucedo TaxID=29922 RepID=UPI00221E7799|nr:uncharacterized protein EV154DRAFT_526201 [Mucor mucedo]KAI7876148.1 hypothetical protein EV154DRAFT_526201 [Mucor mucedo]
MRAFTVLDRQCLYLYLFLVLTTTHSIPPPPNAYNRLRGGLDCIVKTNLRRDNKKGKYKYIHVLKKRAFLKTKVINN